MFEFQWSRHEHRSPLLAIAVATGIAAYHRWSLALWTALAAAFLLVAWFFGGNSTLTVVLVVLSALVAIPLLMPGIRKSLVIGANG